MVHGARRMRAVVTLLALVAFMAARRRPAAASGSAPSADPTTDKLAQIQARGTLVGYAELDYPPQSIRDRRRLAGDRNEVPAEPDDRPRRSLASTSRRRSSSPTSSGVEACFVQPTFTEVTAGGWTDRLDIAYALGGDQRVPDGAPLDDPALLLHPAGVRRARGTRRTRRRPDLDGKTIGTCTSCTVESYLQGTLEIPGVELVQKVKDPRARRASRREGPGIDALAARRARRLPHVRAGRPSRRSRTASRSACSTSRPSRCTRAGSSTRSSGLSVKAFVERRSTRSSRRPTPTARSRRFR